MALIAGSAARYAALMQERRVAVPGAVNKLITFPPRILLRGVFLRAVARSQPARFRPCEPSLSA